MPDKESEYLFHNQAKTLLEKKLKREVQFADSSRNSNYNLANSYIIYGNKIINAGVQHNYILLEVCLANFLSNAETPFVATKYHGWISNLYSFRFVLVAVRTIKTYIPYLISGKTGDKLVENKDYMSSVEYFNMMYQTDRPSYNISELMKLERMQIDEAHKIAKMRLPDIPGTVNHIAKIENLARRNNVTLIAMVFPEFSKEELISLIDSLNKNKIKYVYLDSIREYSNRRLWIYEHPSFPDTQMMWAQEFVEKAIPLLNLNLTTKR